MKILVVDDEKTLVKGMKFNLENEGYEVECAYDGTSALELAREGRFDLILLDVMMPEMDGLEACMKIREFSNVPIIMLTAKSEDADKLMGFECGADEALQHSGAEGPGAGAAAPGRRCAAQSGRAFDGGEAHAGHAGAYRHPGRTAGGPHRQGV